MNFECGNCFGSQFILFRLKILLKKEFKFHRPNRLPKCVCIQTLISLLSVLYVAICGLNGKLFVEKKNSWEMRSQRALVTDWNWRSLEWHKYTLFSLYNTQQRITQCLGGKANEHTVPRIRMIQWHKVKGISNDQNRQSIHEIHFDILTFIVNIKIKKTQRNRATIWESNMTKVLHFSSTWLLLVFFLILSFLT